MAENGLSKSELVTRLQRARNAMANIRKETEQITERLTGSILTVSGGVTSGVMRGWDETGEPIMVPGTEIPADAASAAVGIALGVSGLAGNASGPIASLASGMGAAAAAFHTREMVRKARTK